MTTVTALLTNKAYGFPTRGARRRVKAPILACIHITGNRRTAANPDRHQAALDERNYANRAGSNGPSAHYYVARDGWAIEAIDPAKYAAWSNGDVASPNTANAGDRQGARPAREGLQRQRGVLARVRVRRLRLDVPDHGGPEAVLRHPDRRDGQGDGAAGEPHHRPRPQRPQQRQPGVLPLSQGEPRGVPRRRHRPRERDPAAADHHGHREVGRQPARRSPPRTG